MEKYLALNPYELRLLLAFLLGSAIGTERQLRHKMAGMRTNALVAIGAALFVILGEKIMGDSSSAARIAAQIASGIGFLGAGVIMKDSFNISGLNTAATVWCSGAVGALCGMGYNYEAVLGSFFVLISHILLLPLGNMFLTKYSKYEKGERRYTLKVNCTNAVEKTIREKVLSYIKKNNMRIVNMNLEYDKVTNESIIVYEVLSEKVSNEDVMQMMQNINDDDDVTRVFWEVEVDTR